VCSGWGKGGGFAQAGRQAGRHRAYGERGGVLVERVFWEMDSRPSVFSCVRPFGM
jgi:hypothetical protein